MNSNDNYVTALKKELRIKYNEKERIISNVTEKFIRKRGLILYGGLAIDKWIKNVTNNQQSIYDRTIDRIDYDCFSTNYDVDSKDLSAELMDAGLKNIRIVSGITGSTRKIFIDLDPDAYIDISDIDKAIHVDLTVEEKIKNLNVKIIDEMLVADPNYLKIDQYTNLCTNLFCDYNRITKAFERVSLLEYYFPITSNMMIKEIISDVKPNYIQGIYDIYSGDLAINYLLFGKLSGNYHVAELIGPSFYISATVPLTNETIRIATPHMLLWKLYLKRFIGENVNDIDVKIASIIKTCGLDFKTNYKILIPKITKKTYSHLIPTFFVNKINGEYQYKVAEKPIAKKKKE